MMELWLPSKLTSILQNTEVVGLQKTERIAQCLFLAKNEGGDFWPLLERAADQIISHYQLSGAAGKFLRDNVKGNL